MSTEHWEPSWPGDEVTGTVIRMPEAGVHHGRKLILQGEGVAVLVNASARAGHTLLANELERQAVGEGDQVSIRFDGWQANADGTRRYRRYHLGVMAADGGA